MWLTNPFDTLWLTIIASGANFLGDDGLFWRQSNKLDCVLRIPKRLWRCGTRYVYNVGDLEVQSLTSEELWSCTKWTLFKGKCIFSFSERNFEEGSMRFSYRKTLDAETSNKSVFFFPPRIWVDYEFNVSALRSPQCETYCVEWAHPFTSYRSFL
mgnify:CR=1 FL=1